MPDIQETKGDTPTDQKPPELLTQEEAAAYLRVSRTTFWRIIKAGAIKTYRIPGSDRLRFKREDLLEPVNPTDDLTSEKDTEE